MENSFLPPPPPSELNKSVSNLDFSRSFCVLDTASASSSGLFWSPSLPPDSWSSRIGKKDRKRSGGGGWRDKNP